MVNESNDNGNGNEKKVRASWLSVKLPYSRKLFRIIMKQILSAKLMSTLHNTSILLHNSHFAAEADRRRRNEIHISL